MKTLGTMFLTFLVVVGCASVTQSRKDFTKSSLVIKGGTSDTKEWSENLKFERYSWYRETVLNYDILLAELNADSNFSEWLGVDLPKIDKCEKFYVGLFYSKFQADVTAAGLVSQIDLQGYETSLLPDLSDNLKAHPNTGDWQLTNHRVVGICQKDSLQSAIKIKVPGFQTHKLK